MQPNENLTSYQKFVIGVLAFLQFTIILDFMILSPLGAILMPAMNMTTKQFGLVVSAYAFSAGISGILSAGFADKFDRKKFLLFFYSGFLVGTLMCGLAQSYESLLVARIVTGLFGGVIGSVVFAITTDLFEFKVRGRVMGIVQTSFAASQVVGIPFALFLSNKWGWHAPFMLIVFIGLLAGFIILIKLQPIRNHLQSVKDNAFFHLIHTLTQKRYLQGFISTALLATGGFMLMPFGSAFNVKNLGIDIKDLPLIYVATGVFSIVVGPLAGRYSDKLGKFKIFVIGSAVTITTLLIYSNLGITPLWLVMLISALMFAGVTARMIGAAALTSALPEPKDRGAYMAVSASIQQISGGIAAAIAGLIVVQKADGPIENFDVIGYVVSVTTLITIVLLYFLNQYIMKKQK